MPWTKLNEKEKVCFDYGKDMPGRYLAYAEAIREALYQSLTLDQNVIVMGQGINDKVGMFDATTGLSQSFGEERVFDTPIAETAMTGIAVGAAMAGLRPVYCHNRPDFLMLAMDQIVNHASKYNYMSGGQCTVPMVIWAVTGQGWGSAAQHSQALHGLFMHIPGLKVIMPTTPYDAKGLFISAIADNNPVLILDHRRIYNQEGNVPEEMYKIPIGKGTVRKEGKDITIVAVSSMVIESLKAAEQLEKEGISAEVLDLRSIKPLDEAMILNSVRKTGRLVVTDTGWKTCGTASEIMALASEKAFPFLKQSVRRVTLPDIPTPASYTLENAYYKCSNDIIQTVKDMMQEEI